MTAVVKWSEICLTLTVSIKGAMTSESPQAFLSAIRVVLNHRQGKKSFEISRKRKTRPFFAVIKFGSINIVLLPKHLDTY